MKCPSCTNLENKVVDSRLIRDGELIRRRRECLNCQDRFTTYEQIENSLPVVIKKDGRREEFDKKKIFSGIKKACEKRPVSINTLEQLVLGIEKIFHASQEKEIPSSIIGERVMEEMHKLDEVAYVRFASVYRSFKDIDEFMDELNDIQKQKKAE